MKNIDNKKMQDSLDERLENLEEQKKIIINSLSETIAVKNSIENESSSVTTWMGDNIFRPDNPKRKKDAINALSNLANTIELTMNKSSELENLTIELKLMIGLMSDWAEYVKDIIPILDVHIAVPSLSSSAAETWDTIIGVTSIVFSAALASLFVTGPLFMPVAALALILDVVFIFIGGIMVGEERKKSFEKIKEEADKECKELEGDSLKQLNTALIEANKFFKESAISFKAAGWDNISENSTPKEVRKVLEKNIGLIQKWSNAYKTVDIMVENGMDIDIASDIAASLITQDKNEKAEYVILLKAANLYPNYSVNDLVSKLDIKLEDAQKLVAQKMLIDGETPDKIASALNIPIENVEIINTKNKELTELRLAA